MHYDSASSPLPTCTCHADRLQLGSPSPTAPKSLIAKVSPSLAVDERPTRQHDHTEGECLAKASRGETFSDGTAQSHLQQPLQTGCIYPVDCPLCVFYGVPWVSEPPGENRASDCPECVPHRPRTALALVVAEGPCRASLPRCLSRLDP